MNFFLKKILPHVLIIAGFIIVSLAYFSPVLKGQKIFQSDIMHYTGMAKQQVDFKAETGEETYWTNSAFGGMPTYQLGAIYPYNYIKKLDLTLRFLPRPADYLFVYLFAFYVFLLTLKIDYKIAALGALAFGFSTYLIIILGVGHNSKANAIAYFPLVLSGIILTFRKKYVLGFLLTTVALGLELVANHFQMTYYLLLLVLVLGLAYLFDAYRKNMLPHFFKSVGLLIPAVILAIGLNATNIMATQEYVKESVRGPSDLTINADGSAREKSTGLSKEYITEYSYGIVESFNLFIPRFMGGGSYEDVGRDSETFKFYRSIGATPAQALQEVKRTPTYWGDQTIVEAPAYVGAVILFLFILALFLVKGRLKWWLLGGAVLSLLLSFGKNFSLLTNFFIDYVPLYNKFRAVSSIQVILELCIPALGVFALVRYFNMRLDKELKLKALKYSVGITAGLCVIFLAFKSSLFSFSGAHDNMYRDAYGQAFIDALVEDRMTFFIGDTIRSLVLVLLSAGTLFFFLKEKVSEKVVIVLFALFIVFDLVGVDRRYVNDDDFVPASRVDRPFRSDASDKQIMADPDNFRVFDISKSSSPAQASYFHNSLSGYHAAKLKRMNNVLEFYVYKNNINVLNMLNTKYILTSDESGQRQAMVNPEANGNAWFIKALEVKASTDEEILALGDLNNKEEAVIQKFENMPSFKEAYAVDSLATIKTVNYKPNHITYETNNPNDGFVVFSEMYYEKGWNAYINNELVDHYRVNYLLRGLPVSKGKHTIDFKFEPEVVKTGSSIALATSLLIGLLILGGFIWELTKSTKPKQSA